MNMSAIDSIGRISGVPQPDLGQSVGNDTGDGFGELLGKAIDELNQTQTEADDLTARLAAGEAVDIHDATLAMEKANIAFQFALQVRTKVVEAYQDIMRMQV